MFSIELTFLLWLKRSHTNVLKPGSTAFKSFPRGNIIAGNTASDLSFERFTRWIEECISSHEYCGRGEEGAPLPSRLLDVTPIYGEAGSGVRLVQTTDARGTYACLSHCWGKAPIEARTTRHTLDAFKRLIPWSLLPKTFQDAITIARKLRIQYLWIDSLCIIQGDKRDWEIESAKIIDVYRNGYLTIAATSSPGSHHGCFSTTSPDVCLRIDGGTGKSFLVAARLSNRTGGPNKEAFYKQYPLFERAWFYQERLMSRRILHCKYGEFSFECRQDGRDECSNRSLFPHMSFANINFPSKRDHYLKLSERNRHSLRDRWVEMVSEYSMLRLSVPSDKLPAISGCAKELRALSGDRYLAGLWEKTLARDLVWQTLGAPTPSCEWRAPSWSWASVDSVIKYADPKAIFVNNDSIRDASVEYCSEDTTGQVKSGHIRLAAKLVLGYLRYHCHLQSVRIHLTGPYEIFANDSTTNSRRWRRNHQKMTCKDPPDLKSRRLDCSEAVVKFFPDAIIQTLRLDFSIEMCSNPQDRCALAEIFFLHCAIMPERLGDFFMVLRRQAELDIYSRIGMMTISHESPDDRKAWHASVWDDQVAPEQLITLV